MSSRRFGPALLSGCLSLVGLAALVLGCAASGDDRDRGSDDDGASGAGGDPGTGAGGSGGFSPTGGGGGPPSDAEVFAHSDSTLYRLDPVTKNVTVVGDFSGCAGSVIDIAIDKDGVMFGTTWGSLNRIDKSTAACTPVATGEYPNSLSFVPQGTVDPNEEALVGYEGSTYMRIDKVSGATTTIGDLGDGYISSGDIVSVIGGGTYLTVKGDSCSDCIVEVDPVTGAMVNVIGALHISSVWGLAFWGGSAYGFNDWGELYQIDLSNGTTTGIPIPNPPSGLGFWGAGSTTAAPLTPPE